MLLNEFVNEYQKSGLAEKAFTILTNLEGLNKGDKLILKNKIKNYYLESIGNNYIIISNGWEEVEDWGRCTRQEVIENLDRFVRKYKIKEISLY